MFKKSVHVDLIYTELPMKERFAAAKKDGFDYVEFYFGGWDEKTPEELAELKRMVQGNGLQISGISAMNPFSMCDPATRDQFLEHMKRIVNASNAVGCPVVMTHSNTLASSEPFNALPLSEEYSDNRKFCAMFDVLQRIAPWGNEAGVTFCVEPLSHVAHKGNFMHDTTTCADLIKAVNSSRVKVLYDAYHMYIEEGKIMEMLSRYIDCIGHIHIADAPGRHEPGTGAVNYRNVLKHIALLPYDGFVSFEFYPLDDSTKAMDSVKEVCKGIV